MQLFFKKFSLLAQMDLGDQFLGVFFFEVMNMFLGFFPAYKLKKTHEIMVSRHSRRLVYLLIHLGSRGYT